LNFVRGEWLINTPLPSDCCHCERQRNDRIETAIELSQLMSCKPGNNWLPPADASGTRLKAPSNDERRQIPIDSLQTDNRNICCLPTAPPLFLSLSLSVFTLSVRPLYSGSIVVEEGGFFRSTLHCPAD